MISDRSKVKKRNLENKKNQKGSALVLTVIVLVNALIIVAAISAISVIERKMSSRVKNSAPAFQAADSSVEWVLYKIGAITNPVTETLADVFNAETTGMDASTGRYDCPAILGSVDCEFYFVDDAGTVIDDDTTTIINIDSVRSTGRYGESEEKASRAIEVMMEITHCPEDFVPVSDFCIQLDETANADAETWEDSTKECAVDYNARLCTAAEWITACELSTAGTISLNDIIGGWEWVDDMISTTEALLIGNGATCTNTSNDTTDGPTHDFRCCVDLQQ